MLNCIRCKHELKWMSRIHGVCQGCFTSTSNAKQRAHNKVQRLFDGHYDSKQFEGAGARKKKV